MSQSQLTLLLDALAIGSTGWLATSFALGLVDLWRRCDPAVVKARSKATAPSRPELPQLSNTPLPKLGSEQPVDPDPDFDIELEDVGAIASFDERFA